MIRYESFLTPVLNSPYHSPTGFSADTVNNPDGIDRTSKYLRLQKGSLYSFARKNLLTSFAGLLFLHTTVALTVNRDNGNAELASDWLNACQLGDLSPSSIQFVGLFVDTSGSMTLNTVRSSYDKFLVDLEAAGLTFAQVFNNQERWIDPFLTTLAP